MPAEIQKTVWGEKRRYLTDDCDQNDAELEIFMGGNGDWYIGVGRERQRLKACVRITTSGQKFSGVMAGVATMYRSLGGENPDVDRLLLEHTRNVVHAESMPSSIDGIEWTGDDMSTKARDEVGREIDSKAARLQAQATLIRSIGEAIQSTSLEVAFDAIETVRSALIKAMNQKGEQE